MIEAVRRDIQLAFVGDIVHAWVHKKALSIGSNDIYVVRNLDERHLGSDVSGQKHSDFEPIHSSNIVGGAS